LQIKGYVISILYGMVTGLLIGYILGKKGMVGVARDISERKKEDKRRCYSSLRDSLTGLYNRTFVDEELKRLDTEGQLPISVIVGDINNLKLINNTLGRHQGDKLLKKVARILKTCCRKEDIVARWGGDEFVILLPKTEERAAEGVCNRIQEACKKANIQGSIALGVATKEKPEQDMQKIIQEAENRMYWQKLLDSQSGRGSLVAFLEKTFVERSRESQEHVRRLQKMATLVGRAIGLPAGELNKLILLAAFHDLGKMAIPDHILNKKGALSPGEWEIMKRHSEIGCRIAQSSPELAPIANDILAHHEWWDGSGYPRGLKGEDIPLLARIIAIIDAFDVMLNGRSYKQPMSFEEALEEIKRGAGTQFDPRLVEVFIREITKPEVKKELRRIKKAASVTDKIASAVD